MTGRRRNPALQIYGDVRKLTHYQVCGVAWRQENSLPDQEDKNVSICVDMSTVRYVIITIMLFPDLVLILCITDCFIEKEDL